MPKQISALLIPLTLLAACATPPAKIEPTPVLADAYTQLTCPQLAAQYDEAATKLADAEKRQNKAVAADAVGVGLAFIPVSKFTGDAHEEVALHKGQVATIRQVQLSKSCVRLATPAS